MTREDNAQLFRQQRLSSLSVMFYVLKITTVAELTVCKAKLSPEIFTSGKKEKKNKNGGKKIVHLLREKMNI